MSSSSSHTTGSLTPAVTLRATLTAQLLVFDELLRGGVVPADGYLAAHAARLRALLAINDDAVLVRQWNAGQIAPTRTPEPADG